MTEDSSQDRMLDAPLLPVKRAMPFLEIKRAENGWVLESVQGSSVVEEREDEVRTAVDLLHEVAEHLGLRFSSKRLHFRILVVNGEGEEVD